MDEMRRNLWVGGFVLCGLLAMGALIVLFGRGPTWLMSRGTYPLHIRFAREVTEIRPGNLVTVKGITIGRVTSIGLWEAHPGTPQPAAPATVELTESVPVDVVVAIENAYRLPKGCTARTVEPMLGQGRPPIEIIVKASGEGLLEPGATIDGEAVKAFDAVFPPQVVATFETAARQIGDAADAMTPVLNELEQALQQRSPAAVDRGEVQGNLSSAVARFDHALKHFNEVLGDEGVKSQLRETIANVHDMSIQGKQVMSDLEVASGDGRAMMSDARRLITRVDQTVEKVDARVDDVAQAMIGTLDRADNALDQLAAIGQGVRNGEGTMGHLFMDAKLYESMVFTTERLTQALEEFRALIAEWREGKVRIAL